ncbi:hypothetical protein MRB53_028590 [Persea americana]|uniref:Uncharacterized protein n=1 Tax=Persea americana TaxID=3435 RepID=A0ACC2KGC1_PERAE|nr:hypothetical protein MRB53_028590 [Persea americana]
MMLTKYTVLHAKPPSYLASSPSGPGQHHVHDVNQGHCRMSTWEVNFRFTRSTSQGVMSTGQTVNSPGLDPADDAIYETPVVGDYGWGPADQVVEPEDGALAQGD